MSGMDDAVEQILSLHAIYSGPEEVIVKAKVHPSAHMNIEKLTRAVDDLDHKIRPALSFVADVFHRYYGEPLRIESSNSGSKRITLTRRLL
jgi:hypothetical protein